MTNSNLKKCICGKTPNVIEWKEADGLFDGYTIECLCGVTTYRCATKEEARNDWNHLLIKNYRCLTEKG